LRLLTQSLTPSQTGLEGIIPTRYVPPTGYLKCGRIVVRRSSTSAPSTINHLRTLTHEYDVLWSPSSIKYIPGRIPYARHRGTDCNNIYLFMEI